LSILDKMHFRALDENFNAIAILDDYESAIWTERYSDIGDFEIHGPNNPQLLVLANSAAYVFNSATSSLMIIEKPKTSFSDEDGIDLTISGRSFESFLDRRVMLQNKTIFSPTPIRISEIICNLVSEAFGNTYAGRYWADLVVINDTPEQSVKLQANVAMQFATGENLLDIVTNLCLGYGLGFKCRFSTSDKKMHFIVYEGVNRTLQGDNFVVFSDLYDNLLMASDEAQFGHIKNTVVVVGNKEVDPVTQKEFPAILVGDPKWTGLFRRETFFQADQDATVYINDTTQRDMTNEEYVAALTLKGVTELNNVTHQSYKSFNGEIIETPQCQYGTHFNLGDVVLFNVAQVGTSAARLDGVTFSDSVQSGKTMAPDFTYGV
jgi:hypothetical protein